MTQPLPKPDAHQFRAPPFSAKQPRSVAPPHRATILILQIITGYFLVTQMIFGILAYAHALGGVAVEAEVFVGNRIFLFIVIFAVIVTFIGLLLSGRITTIEPPETPSEPSGQTTRESEEDPRNRAYFIRHLIRLGALEGISMFGLLMAVSVSSFWLFFGIGTIVSIAMIASFPTSGGYARWLRGPGRRLRIEDYHE